MQIRTFAAGSMPAALDRVREALGPDAVLLKTRMIRTGDRVQVEITAATDLVPSRPAQRMTSIDEQAWGDMEAALEGARTRIESLQSGDPDTTWLGHCDFLPGLADELLAATEKSGDRRSAIASILQERIQAVQGVLPPPDRPRRIALIGPPGAGKTTALVKLAAGACATGRTDVALVNLDSYRPGAEDYLAQVGDTLGVPVLSERSTDVQKGLPDVEGLILIDTDSRIYASEQGTTSLRACLERLAPDLTALVLPAAWRAADLHEALGRYLVCRPSHLVFSGLDLTIRYGGILSIAAVTGLPVAFVLTTGRFDSGTRMFKPDLLIQQMNTLYPATAGGKENVIG